jgi:hypothetical protein
MKRHNIAAKLHCNATREGLMRVCSLAVFALVHAIPFLAATPAAAQSTGTVPAARPVPLTAEQLRELRRRGDRALARWTSPTLTAFRDEDELRAYLRDLREAARARRDYWSSRNQNIRFAAAALPNQQSDTPEPICTTPEDCPELPTGEGSGDVIVTSARRASNGRTGAVRASNPTIRRPASSKAMSSSRSAIICWSCRTDASSPSTCAPEWIAGSCA